jgi:replicative DNA helicase
MTRSFNAPPSVSPEEIAQLLPPQAMGAEMGLLGVLLCSGTQTMATMDLISGRVDEADFYNDDHRRIFHKITEMAAKGRSVDVITVSEALELSNELEQVGGLSHLGELANQPWAAASIDEYSDTIRDRSLRRKLKKAGEQIIKDAVTSQSPPEELLASTEELITKLRASRGRNKITDLPSLAVQVVEALHNPQPNLFTTGLKDLDEKLEGIQPGDLMVVAGRPSMGKTSLAINIVNTVSDRGEHVVVFSLEMSAPELTKKILALRTGISTSAMKKNSTLSSDNLEKLAVEAAEMKLTCDIIDDENHITNIVSRVRQKYRETKGQLKWVMVDYVQLVYASAKGGQIRRDQEIGEITRALKALARELGVIVVCVAQISRKAEERPNKRPLMSDLRESGSIEQDADIILMLYRDDYYNPGSPFAGVAEVLVVKHRGGPVGNLYLKWNPTTSKFSDADNSYTELAATGRVVKPVKTVEFKKDNRP